MFKIIKERVFSTKEGRIILLIFLIAAVIYLRSGKESVLVNNTVIREDYGGKKQSVAIEAEIEESGRNEIEIDILNRQYSEDELNSLYDELYPVLISMMLGHNESGRCIMGDLNFIESLDGYPFEFTWRVLDKGAIDENGKLIAHEDGSTIVFLYASCDEWEKEDSLELYYKATRLSASQTLAEQLLQNVKEIEEESRTKESFELPTTINGKNIKYRDPSAKREPIVFLLALVASVAIIYGSMADKKKKEKERNTLLLKEYSMVIQKMVMYLSAGVSLRNVWSKVYEDSKEFGKSNPIYEEMGITLNELRNGVSEPKAYLSFSKRIGMPAITRFTTLLIQNLKKGSTNLSELLSEEAYQAFETRKRIARTKGEETGTLLLIPMILIMIVIMVIIMVPALWSM